jgi:peptide/nickel transport system permease protein
MVTENHSMVNTTVQKRFSLRVSLHNIYALITSSPVATVGFSITFMWVLIAVFAPLLAPYDPLVSNEAIMNQAPTPEHWLGTDTYGRDVLSRVIYGARPVLLLAPISVLISMTIGILLGLPAAYFRGKSDETIMRLVDVIMSFPVILIYMIVITVLGPSPLNIIVAVTIAGAPGIARLVRSLALDICTREYIAAAKVRGENSWYIMFVEILPNARGPLIIDGMLRVGYAIFAIGTLGFLGLGLRPPTPDWGSMVNEARKVASYNPAAMIWPSLAIASLVIGLNLLADGLRESSMRYQQ